MYKSSHVENEDKMAFPCDFIKVKSESGSEDVHYSFFYEELPEEFRLVAQNTLNETEENKKEGLKELKEFIEKEKLPSCTEEDIIGVLRYAKYNITKAKIKLKKFLNLRQKTIQLLCKMDEEKTEYILEDSIFGVLPYRDKHGSAIIFTRPTTRFNLYSMEDIRPVGLSFLLFLYSFPMTMVCGLSHILECKTDNIFVYYTLIKDFRTYIYAFLEMPVRFCRTVSVNENFIIRWFFNAVRPFIPTKLTSRVSFNGPGYEILKTIYGPDILPEDFEGNLSPISNNKYFNRKFKDFMEKLKSEKGITQLSNG